MRVRCFRATCRQRSWFHERLRQDSNLLPPASKAGHGDSQRLHPFAGHASPSSFRGPSTAVVAESPPTVPARPSGPLPFASPLASAPGVQALRTVRTMLTVRDVAAVLRVGPDTVRVLCRRGELASLRVSNAIRIRPADLEAFLRRVED